MKDIDRMRKLAGILTESVMAVPGVGNSESNMQTASDAGIGADDAAFDSVQPDVTETATLGNATYDQLHARFSELMQSFVDPQEAFDLISQEMDEQGIEADEADSIMQRLEDEFFPSDSEQDQFNSDGEADADALASAGWGSDEDYSSAEDMMEEEVVDEAFDLNNGYDDIEYMNPGDFFPTGADSPVTSATGTAGARQGDNPEQKRVQVAETHKELVYNYRKFLKEESIQLTELSKDTLKSYSKKKGERVSNDKKEAESFRGHAKYAKNAGDTKSAELWNKDADTLDKRAEQDAGKIAKAVIKTAKK